MTTSPLPLPIIELRDVSVVRGRSRLLDAVSFSLREGEHAAIVGANGSGKSTLIKVITGQIYPSAPFGGDPPVVIFGRERWNLTELRSRLGLVSADLQHRFVAGSSLGRVTGLDAVTASFFGSEVLFMHHEVSPDQRHRAYEALERVGAEGLAGRRTNEMSTGEIRRVLIARALVHAPRVLVLDEPTNGLDLVARGHFLGMLREIARAGTTLILVTHHVEEILPEIGRVLVMCRGRLAADGKPSAVLTSEVLSAAYEAPVTLRSFDGRFELSADEVPDNPSEAPIVA